MKIDNFLNTSGEEINGAMENMDVSLNYDNPELMSSEFFDSVLSLENNLEDGFLSTFDDDINLSSDTSSHMDEVLSPQSLYSESDKNSSFLMVWMNHFLMSLLEPVQGVRIETPNVPALIKPTLQKQPTKILIQNPNNKKFIAKPMITASQFKKSGIKAKPHILKVQPISNNGRPVLLPLSVKSIQILNTPTNVSTFSGNLKRRKTEPVIQTISPQEDEDNNVVSSTNQYPPLSLTSEEKRLLTKEGIQLPTHHPLTKNEERELKRIRRKIRNKISAQDSRKRKKEYVDGLEERVKRGSEENKNLLQRVKELQRQNRNLIAHVSKLQALICNSSTSKATPSTCLMVVLLSALLVSLPNMKLFENKQMSTEQEQVAVRRSLLTTEDDSLNMEEFLVFKDEESEFENKFNEDALDIENSTDKEFSKLLEEMGKKIFNTVKSFLEKDQPELFGKPDYGGYYNKKGFIEPDIDDYIPVDEDPPSKRMKFMSDKLDPVVLNNEQVVSTTVTANNFGISSKNK
ncbi:hypothetical protein NQ317_001951 [Molorchus minor]|uniref:BZIP domain-containing protein n=1 Tax=Molorchus minor TaxID=1323400 RepID=A0ABQ9IW11_9CUCU|nr:hypothetical protein NQ317_001951 [Molorchus minor]